MKEYALKHGMYIHLHLLETQYQAEYAKRTWVKSFIKHYKEIGFLGPWVSFAHAVWLDEEDLQLIAESGAHLITNPSSNLRLRSGIFNMQRANELGIDCGIGLDGCAFDDDQDYLREIRVAWLNNLHNGVDGEVDYKDALKMAIRNESEETHERKGNPQRSVYPSPFMCIDSRGCRADQQSAFDFVL